MIGYQNVLIWIVSSDASQLFNKKGAFIVFAVDNPTYEVGSEKPVSNNDNSSKRKSRPPSMPLPPIPGQQV